MVKNQNSHKTPGRKRRKWPWIVLGILGVFILLLRLSLLTRPVHSFVKKTIVNGVNQSLNGQLSIKHLNGDLWKDIQLRSIDLRQASDTLVHIDSVRIHYNVLSYFSDAFTIPQLDIYQPGIKLKQDNRGTWNISQLIPPDTSMSTESQPFYIDIRDLNVRNGKARVDARQILPDTTVYLRQFQMQSSLAFLESGMQVQLKNLGFSWVKNRTGQPINVQTKAQIDGKHYSLEQLVINSGSSLFSLYGNFNGKADTLNASSSAQPIAWKDLNAYSPNMPLRQNLDMDLTLSGSLSALKARLNIKAPGLDGFQVNLGLQVDSLIALHSLDMDAEKIDFNTLFVDAGQPVVKDVQLRSKGNLIAGNWDESSWTGTLDVKSVADMDYMLDGVQSTFNLEKGHADVHLALQQQKQKLELQANGSKLFTDQPEWNAHLDGQHINPGYWTQDTTQVGDLNFEGSLNGVGFEPGSNYWKYRLTIRDSHMMGQPFGMASFDGSINATEIHNNSTFRLDKSRMKLDVRVRDYTGRPSYSYQLNVNDLDLSELQMFPDFSSDINAKAEGRGSGTEITNMQLSSSFQVDSSIVNGEAISSFQCGVEVRDTVLNVNNAVLKSSIADGQFAARSHLVRYYDLNNSLNLNISVKNISSLAPLLGVKQLGANGEIKGKLHPSTSGNLELDASVGLKNVVYNEMLQVDDIEGRIHGFIMKEPEYFCSLEFKNPKIESVVLKDLAFSSNGKIRKESVNGDYELDFSSSSDAEAKQQGTFFASSDSVLIRTNDMTLNSQEQELTLQNAYNLSYVKGRIKLDTLRVSGTHNSFLEAAIPNIDSLQQSVYFRGRNLNLSVIQNSLMNQIFVDGMLNGTLNIERDHEKLSADGGVMITALQHENIHLDTLNLNFNIHNERLKADFSVENNNETLMKAEGNLPFKLGDPTQFDPEFFAEPVQGSVTMEPVQLNQLGGLLKQFDIKETSGLIQFNGQLSGKAGMPMFDGTFKMTDTKLSGVPVDSMIVNMDYDHEDSYLALNATLNSMKQNAASLNTRIPLHIDLRTFNMRLPRKQDSIDVKINTNNFNLAALNGFVDQQQMRNIKGYLDGKVLIKGKISDLNMNGHLSLQNGNVRITPAGISLSDMTADLDFKPGELQLQKFSASSGGTFTANGSLSFNGLLPEQMDLNLKARSLKIANTENYNAIITSNTHLGGSVTKPKISGDLTIDRGFANLQNFGEKSVEEVNLDTTKTPVNSEFNLYDSLSVDMDISVNRNFYIRNRKYLEMQIQFEGQVDVLKEPEQDLQVFGNLDGVKGYAQPLGKRFNLDKANIVFSGPPANPQLNIRTSYKPPQPKQDITIWYIIEGTVENPKFRYDSDPHLELENILSYTLFGQPYYALDSWKQVVANPGGNGNGSAMGLAADVLLDRVESLATKKLGIDVVQIDNTRSGSSGGTTIKTGWYLNDRTFFAILNQISGSSPNTMFIIEYLLKKNLQLILTQGGDNRDGVDLKWEFDY